MLCISDHQIHKGIDDKLMVYIKKQYVNKCRSWEGYYIGRLHENAYITERGVLKQQS